MRWASKTRWLLLAVTWRTSQANAAPVTHPFLLPRSANADDSALFVQPPGSHVVLAPEVEQSLPRSRAGDDLHADDAGDAKFSVVNDAATVAERFSTKVEDVGDDNNASYERVYKRNVHGRRLRRTGRADDRGSRAMRLAPDGEAAPGYEDYQVDAEGEGNQLPGNALETAGFEAPSHLQVASTQIIDQLMTGMLGTGLNMMQGQQPAAAAAAPAVQPFGPTPMYYPAQETGLSTVEIILIISGSILIIGLVGLLVWLVMSKQKRRR